MEPRLDILSGLVTCVCMHFLDLNLVDKHQTIRANDSYNAYKTAIRNLVKVDIFLTTTVSLPTKSCLKRMKLTNEHERDIN